MTSDAMAGKVMTVLGSIDPEELGITLMHEHLFADGGCYNTVPPEASLRSLVDRPVSFDMLGSIGRLWNVVREHTQMYSYDEAVSEVTAFKLAGGRSLVEATSIGIGRDPLAMARVSRATGLNVIMGGGYYVPAAYPTELAEMTEDQVYDRLARDVTHGVGDTGIRTGIIGEVGVGGSMSQMAGAEGELPESKVLRAAARAQAATGAPMLIHPSPFRSSLAAVAETVLDAGADPNTVVFAHMDVQADVGVLEWLADMGFNVEYDAWGIEDSEIVDSVDPAIQLPNDMDRLGHLRRLIEAGHLERLVITQDVFLRLQLASLGGKGYGHLLENIVPRMRSRGFTEMEIDTLLVGNPRRILTFA
jgi:phosphotriesterase-related protein